MLYSMFQLLMFPIISDLNHYLWYTEVMKYLTSREMSEVVGVSQETLKKQRFRGNSPYKFIKSNTGRVLYLPPEVRQKQDNHRDLSTLSTEPKSREPRSKNKGTRNSGNGFHSKSRYWSAGSQLRNINDLRHRARLEREAKENAKEVYQEEKIRSVRTLNDDRPRRKFRSYGYSDEPIIEIEVPRSPKPLKFKNYIEEEIHRLKMSQK